MARAMKIALLCLMLLGCLWLAGCSAVPDPTWMSYTQNTVLLPDGGLQVEEQIRLALPAGTREVERLLLPGEGLTVQVSSASWQWSGQSVQSLTLATGEQEDPVGTYTLREEGEGQRLTLSLAPQEKDAQGILILRYIVETPAVRYVDIGTLLWSPLGEKGLPEAVSNVSITMTLGVSKSGQVYAALVSAPAEASLVVETGSVLLRLPKAPANRQVLVRVDFPQGLLAHQQPQPEALLVQRQQQQQRAIDGLALALSWVVACWVVCIVLTIYYYQTADKDPRDVQPESSAHMMGVTAPAELSNLMPFATGAGPYDFSAMVLHLIHRGHLRLYPPRAGLSLTPETIGMARIERMPAPRETLMDGEYFMIHYLVDVLGDGKSMAVSDIHDVKPREFRKDFRAWRKLVDRQIGARPWFEDLRRKRMTLALLGAVLALGSLFVFLVLGGHVSALGGLPAGLWLICYAFIMRKRTPEAMHEINIWRTFQRKLVVGGIGRVDTIAQWERILLYAEAMRMGDQAAALLAERVAAGATYPDAGEATFLAWGLLDYPDQLREWFRLLTDAIRPK